MVEIRFSPAAGRPVCVLVYNDRTGKVVTFAKQPSKEALKAALKAAVEEVYASEVALLGYLPVPSG